MGGQQRHEQQGVLGPLLEPNRAQDGAQGQRLALEHPRLRVLLAQAAEHRIRGVHRHRLRAALPHGQVVVAVAGVGPLGVASGLSVGGDGVALVIAAEVGTTLGAQRVTEQAQVGGHLAHDAGVRRAGQHQRATAGVLVAQVLHEALVVGQTRRVGPHRAGQALLEARLAQPQASPAGAAG